MYINKKELLNSLSDTDIIFILNTLGSIKYKQSTKGLRFQSICHILEAQEDKHLSLYYFKEHQLFKCYSESCSSNKGISLFDLIIKVKALADEEWDIKMAMLYVIEVLDKKPEDFGASVEEVAEMKKNNPLAGKKKNEITYYNFTNDKIVLTPVKFENIDKQILLDTFMNAHHEDWLNEGISHTTMEKYGIMYDFHNNRIVVPHFAPNGDIAAVKVRCLNFYDAKDHKYYFPKLNGVSYAYNKTDNLYGFNFNKDAMKKRKKAILFEGEKSVMKLDDFYGEENNISDAVGGSDVSYNQFKLLYEIGVEEITLAFDKEYSTEEEMNAYIEKKREMVKPYSKVFKFYILVDKNNDFDLKDAPVDKGKIIFNSMFKNRIEL